MIVSKMAVGMAILLPIIFVGQSSKSKNRVPLRLKLFGHYNAFKEWEKKAIDLKEGLR